MSFLELRNLGKIYVSENTVAVGIRGVSVDFDIGEFVVVTGKSGSGKTTLLNCISGMDSYEEGELYVEGEQTSHFTQTDWEEYRQKYISFVFQDYNIIDSFTVLQNVELALTHIDSRAERRRRALELIERVGMTSHKNSKGSKLSGGQKQRTVIARALAKDSPIILADEPTGNLDSRTGEEIVKLLAEISRDKLVIVVTHSLSQFESVATREIRIFDGGVERDEQLRPADKGSWVAPEEKKRKNNDFKLGMELGRHKFFASPKMSVFMCLIMIVAVLGCFFTTATNVAGQDLFDASANLFTYSKGRLVISKFDGGTISPTELEALKSETGAVRYVRYDYAYDHKTDLMVHGNGTVSYYFQEELCCALLPSGLAPDVGRLPEKSYECVLSLPISWQEIFGKDEILKDTIPIYNAMSTLKVVGVKYYYNTNNPSHIYLNEEGFDYATNLSALYEKNGNTSAYVELLDESLNVFMNMPFDTVGVDYTLSGKEYYFQGKIAEEFSGYGMGRIQFTRQSYNTGMSDESYFFNANDDTYTYRKDKTSAEVSSDDEFVYYGSVIMISPEMAAEMADAYVKDGYSQASLFFKNDKSAAAASGKLSELGYASMLSSETYKMGAEAVLDFIVQGVSFFSWIVSVFFLAFFLSLCTVRALAASNGDLAIMRSMGISNRIVKISMYARMLMASVPALALLAIVASVIYTSPALSKFFPFLEAEHYVLIVVGFIALILFVTYRSNKRTFKGTVIKTLRGGNRS